MVAPALLHARFACSPPSAQPACTPCPCRRMPPHPRGTPSHGNGPGPSRPACSGHCRADTANCTVAAVYWIYSIERAVNVHTRIFANCVCNAETLSEILIADTICTALQTLFALFAFQSMYIHCSALQTLFANTNYFAHYFAKGTSHSTAKLHKPASSVML